MSIERVLDLINEDLKNVEAGLTELIDTKVPLINKVISYILSSGGKRLRPAFMILVAKMCNYKSGNITPLSAVIEYIHTATLLHDDIIDGAKYRRGLPSANGIYGNDIAVLCGDFLYSRSYITLTNYGNKRMQNIIANAALVMSEGEVIQLLKTADTNITMDEYLLIVRSKTAVLFSAACEVGGVEAGVDDEKAKLLADFGNFLGIAFQMSDDLLDYLGDNKVTGKKNGTDLYEGKLTLPIILLLKKVTDLEKEKINNIFISDNRTENDLKYITELIIKYNINEEAEEIIAENINKSLSSLDAFEDNEYKVALITLAKNMIKRNK